VASPSRSKELLLAHIRKPALPSGPARHTLSRSKEVLLSSEYPLLLHDRYALSDTVSLCPFVSLSLTQLWMMCGVIRHVCDDHEFTDGKLFFRWAVAIAESLSSFPPTRPLAWMRALPFLPHTHSHT
jgi:hypothetical protein